MASASKLPEPQPLDRLRFHLCDQAGGHLGWLYPPNTFAVAPRIICYGGHYFVRQSRLPKVIGGDEYRMAEVWDAPKTCDSEP